MFYSLEICNKTTKLRYLRFRSTDLLRMIWKNWVHWELGTMELCWRWITRRRGQRWPSRCVVGRMKERWRGGGEEKGRECVCVWGDASLSSFRKSRSQSCVWTKKTTLWSWQWSWELALVQISLSTMAVSSERYMGFSRRDSVGLYNHRTPSLLLLYTYYLMVGRS